MPEIVNEIKDENTRSRLQVLPYELKFRQPSADDLSFVINFAKKTGDFLQLSSTDLKLIALTYCLEKEKVGCQHLRLEPITAKVSSYDNVKQVGEVQIKNDSKFFNYKENSKELVNKNSNDIDIENQQKDSEFIANDDNDKNVNEDDEDINEDDEDADNDEEVDDEDDDNDGWITSDNIEEVKRQLSGIKIEDEAQEDVYVACITGDFAVQNVLMQIGLKVVNIKDGLCIKETKQFVLRCHACFKINPTKNEKPFCKFCGNFKTLKRVAVTVKDDGSKIIRINYKKPINIRGTKYSLPLPKGGKHAVNPVLVADQPLPQQRKSKISIEEKRQLSVDKILNDPDYIARQNPFALNDVNSRSSKFRTNCRVSRNPNETRKPTGNRKKKSK